MSSIITLEQELTELFAAGEALSIEEATTVDLAADAGMREIRTDLSILAMNRPRTKV